MATLKATAGSAPAEIDDTATILTALDTIVYDWDILTDELRWGPNAAEALRGLAFEALSSGRGYAELVTAGSARSRYEAIFDGPPGDAEREAAFRVNYGLSSQDGATLEVEDYGRWFADAEGRPCRAHGVLRVVSRGLQAKPEASGARAFADTVGARRAFNAYVDARCAELKAGGRALALMAVGVGDLVELNRQHGYESADELILGVGRKLAGCLRDGDRLARYAGGKFAALLSLGPHDKAAVAAARIVERINAHPYATAAGPLRAQARAGVALSPRHGRTAHLLLQRADEALALTAASGEPAAVYEADEAQALRRRREAFLGDEIVVALNERRVALAFQPVAPTRDGLPAFEEALLRIPSEDGLVMGPDALLPIAEKLGLIHLLDDRVLELVVAALAAAPARRLAMNVSIVSLSAPGWSERLRDRLAQTPSAAERLTVEVDEAQASDHATQIGPALAEAKALGVRVAIDNFGAGRASFRNLRALSADMVKIDGAFVATLSTSADDRFFVRALVSLARQLGVATVAEWVEDEDSARLLREFGVDYLQGHFIGRAELQQPAAPQRARA